MKPSKGSWNGEFRGARICVGWISTTRLVLWVFMCPTNFILFCVSSISASVFHGYHAEGYHAPSLPPRAITPVCTSRLPHQSYHVPPIHVLRVITPAISNSYFGVLSFAGFYATCTSPPTPPPGATRYNLLHTVHLPDVLLCRAFECSSRIISIYCRGGKKTTKRDIK